MEHIQDHLATKAIKTKEETGVNNTPVSDREKQPEKQVDGQLSLERLSDDEYEERVQSSLDKSRRTVTKRVSEVSKAEKEEARKELKRQGRAAEEGTSADDGRPKTGFAANPVSDNGGPALASQDAHDSAMNRDTEKTGFVANPVSEGRKTEKQSEKQGDEQPSKTEVGETEVGLSGPVFDPESKVLMSDEFCTAFLSSWRGGDGRRSIAR
jgi:hypothetical protein